MTGRGDANIQDNHEHGFSAADDTLPRRFTDEGVPTGLHAAKVCDLKPLLNEYYQLRGWPRGRVAPRDADTVSDFPPIL